MYRYLLGGGQLRDSLTKKEVHQAGVCNDFGPTVFLPFLFLLS
jgi:hypothetical protein